MKSLKNKDEINSAFGLVARKNNLDNGLQQAINLLGHDFLYIDTDSGKYIGEHDFSKINQTLVEYLTYNFRNDTK